MKRLIALVAVIALAAGMATAAPSFYGSNGLFRTISAQNAGPMNFGIGVHGIVYGYMNDSSATSWKTLYYNATIPIEGYFAINDMFELSVAPAYYMQHYKATILGHDYTSDLNGLTDTRAGLKFSYKLSDAFIGGVYAGYNIPTISDTLNPYAHVTDFKHNGALDARLLADYKFGDGCLNLNV
ncbi:MAG TPA: hypothetical protein VMF29_02755, partial [Candidatus Edwardsbacteria bacterium]|nr:hypothetical protein [Candidatus Edwardsbacteria bacterium]